MKSIIYFFFAEALSVGDLYTDNPSSDSIEKSLDIKLDSYYGCGLSISHFDLPGSQARAKNTACSSKNKL